MQTQIEQVTQVRGIPFGSVDDARIQVSAFVDGELDDADVERTIDALLASDELATFWADAHRAGDWMRSDEVVGIGDEPAFLRRLSALLEQEPTVLAPRSSRRLASKRFWIRAGLPGASVAAALVVVAWVASPFGGNGMDGGASTAAVTAPAVMIVSTESGGVAPVSLRTVDVDRLSDYFAVHREVTPFGYRGTAARPVSFTTAAEPAPRQ